MDEVWRLLGISGCSTCMVHEDDMALVSSDARLRNVREAIAAIRAGRGALVAGGSRGYVGRARETVQQQALLSVHLKHWNPFLLLPHVEFACFPMDRLHGMCVM